MILNIFKATRPLNLMIILAVQIMAAYFLGFGNSVYEVFDKVHFSIYLSTLLCAIFGYLFNDFMDQKADSINKPSLNYLSISSIRSTALIVSLSSAIAAILTGFILSFKLGVFNTLAISLLFLYNIFLKRLPLIGNLIIAALGAFPVFILLFFDNNLNKDLILIFSINAFFIHLIREIIKDTQDIDGDEAAGYSTFPLMAGIKATRILLLFLMFTYILIFTTCARLMMVRYFSEPLNYIFLTYNVICIGVPLFHLLSKLQLATEKNEFRYLNKVALYIIVTGSLSMLFF